MDAEKPELSIGAKNKFSKKNFFSFPSYLTEKVSCHIQSHLISKHARLSRVFCSWGLNHSDTLVVS